MVPRMFTPNGDVNPHAFQNHVAAPLVNTCVTGLQEEELWSAYRQVRERTKNASSDSIRESARRLQDKLGSEHGLLTSQIATSKQGERAQEWDFFCQRRKRFPDDPHGCRRVHVAVAQDVTRTLCLVAGVNQLRKRSRHNAAHLFARCKSETSIQRKMAAKGLKRWEVGDVLGFFLAAPCLGDLPALASRVEAEFDGRVLYKQNGYRDSIVDRDSLDPAVARRIFYIVGHDDVVCFELQLVTLRQLVYIHLSHPGYIGAPYGPSDRRALRTFGDGAYLLDMEQLTTVDANEGVNR